MNQIASYEQIKQDLETKIRSSSVVNLSDVIALNSVNSALVDLYKQLLKKVG